LKHTDFPPATGIRSSASSTYISSTYFKREGKKMEKANIIENRKNINFLLENWDMLNTRQIMKLYADGGIF